MTQQEMIKAFAAAGVQVRGTSRDGIAPDGSAVTRYGVIVTIRDDRHGNTVVRQFSETDAVDVDATVKEMRAEVAKRAGETKARARSWRGVNRS